MPKLSKEAEAQFVKAAQNLFIEWAKGDRWHLHYITPSRDGPDDYEEGEPIDITSDPESLAEEIHQIGFDKDSQEMRAFIKELNLPTASYKEIREFIDQHEEHSH